MLKPVVLRQAGDGSWKSTDTWEEGVELQENFG